MSHVTHKSKSCHIHEWVISHTWMCHATNRTEACHTYSWVSFWWKVMQWQGGHEWDMSHVRKRHVTRLHCHVTHMHESPFHWYECAMSCHTYECITSHIQQRTAYSCSIFLLPFLFPLPSFSCAFPLSRRTQRCSNMQQFFFNLLYSLLLCRSLSRHFLF